MLQRILTTSDGKFIGALVEFELESREVLLGDPEHFVLVSIDRIRKLGEGFVLAGSNYVITTTAR